MSCPKLLTFSPETANALLLWSFKSSTATARNSVDIASTGLLSSNRLLSKLHKLSPNSVRIRKNSLRFSTFCLRHCHAIPRKGFNICSFFLGKQRSFSGPLRYEKKNRYRSLILSPLFLTRNGNGMKRAFDFSSRRCIVQRAKQRARAFVFSPLRTSYLLLSPFATRDKS